MNLDPHSWLYLEIIDGRQIVRCRRCDKVVSYRLSEYKPYPPLSECIPKSSWLNDLMVKGG